MEKRIKKEILCRLLSVVREAGEAILEIYNSEFAIEMKEDRSPLTQADRRSNEIIIDHLQHIPGLQTSIPVLSEEGREIPYDERRDWEYFWLVDPLDGTKEFIKRNGEFTVNVALIHKTGPVLGVIYVPVKDVFYFAVQGFGAYKLINSEGATKIMSTAEVNEDVFSEIIALSHKLPLPDRRPPATAAKPQITIVGSRSHATPELQTFVEQMREQYDTVDFVSAGSSLKFCLVAEGSADIYPRLAPTMEWDTGAGQCIVQEAGGSVIEHGRDTPLSYNKESLLNPWFVVKRGETL